MLSGATVDRIPLTSFPDFPIRVPTLPIQRRIAGILSAYDDLIENSQRRIKILEEMARRLYRECFINGQASTAWPAEQLGHFFELKRGYDLPARDRRPGLFPIVSSSGITGFHEAFMARGPGIVTGRYGTLGEVHLVWDEFWPLNTSLYVKDFKGTPFLYVFWLLRHVLPGQKGSAAAVPGLNRNDLHSLLINAPPLNVMQNFHNLCLPLANQTRFLAESIQNLRRTRDMLLPRLLSGQIDVESLPEPVLSES
jgi:type I restriction enzyme S subunit